MKFFLRLVLIAVVIAAGIWLWTILFPNPEKIIRRELSELARDASFTGNQSPLAGIAGAQKVANFFSTNAEVNVNSPGRTQTLAGRDEVMQAAAGARASFDGLKVEFPDVSVTVAPDKQSATADLTVKARIAGNREFIAQMKFTFQKTGRKWLITRVETVRTLT
jgi:ketosteroid isomerase-like protein